MTEPEPAAFDPTAEEWFTGDVDAFAAVVESIPDEGQRRLGRAVVAALRLRRDLDILAARVTALGG